MFPTYIKLLAFSLLLAFTLFLTKSLLVTLVDIGQSIKALNRRPPPARCNGHLHLIHLLQQLLHDHLHLVPLLLRRLGENAAPAAATWGRAAPRPYLPCSPPAVSARGAGHLAPAPGPPAPLLVSYQTCPHLQGSSSHRQQSWSGSQRIAALATRPFSCQVHSFRWRRAEHLEPIELLAQGPGPFVFADIALAMQWMWKTILTRWRWKSCLHYM